MDKHELRDIVSAACQTNYPSIEAMLVARKQFNRLVEPRDIFNLFSEIAELEQVNSQLAIAAIESDNIYRKHLEDTAPAFQAIEADLRQARTLIQSLAEMLDDLISDSEIQNVIDNPLRDTYPISVYCAVIDDADCFLSGREYDIDIDTDRQVINPPKTEVA